MTPNNSCTTHQCVGFRNLEKEDDLNIQSFVGMYNRNGWTTVLRSSTIDATNKLFVVLGDKKGVCRCIGYI